MTTELKYVNNLYKNYMLPPDKIPLIVSNTILAGYFFGEEGLAVVSFLMPLFFLFETFGFWINYGAFTKSIGLVSINESQLARSYSALALTLSAVVGIILFVAVTLNFESMLNLLDIPEELRELAHDYGIPMTVSGIFLVIASYFWQFVKLVGLQARIKKIYVIIMLVDAVITVICVKILGLGINSLAIGMTGALLFVILMAGSWLRKSFRQNLFAKIQNPLKSITEIFLEGSAPAVGKFYSLFIVFLFNLILLKYYGVGGVAIFGAMQTAIRICRLHAQVTWQPIAPIFTMEYADRNLSSMLLFLKVTLQRAFIMAALPTVVIFFGANYFASKIDVDSSLLEFATCAFQAYSLSVIFAAINSVFIIAYSTLNHRIFSNLLEFLRSIALILLFLKFSEPSLMFWSFLFAEVITSIILVAGGLAICKSNNLKSPLLLEPNFFQKSMFAVVDRQQGITDETNKKLGSLANEQIVQFINDWLALVKNFSDTGKNDFSAIHVRNDSDGLKVTLRSMGKLFDYGANAQALKLIQGLRGAVNHKCTFTLGMNNLYLRFVNG